MAVNIRNVNQTAFSSGKDWIFDSKYVSATFLAAVDNVTTPPTPNAQGRLVIPSGSLYINADNIPIGFIINDTDITGGGKEVAVLLQGAVYLDVLATINTIAALNGARQYLEHKIVSRTGTWNNIVPFAPAAGGLSAPLGAVANITPAKAPKATPAKEDK